MATQAEVHQQASAAYEATQEWLNEKKAACTDDAEFLRNLDVSVSALSEASSEGATVEALNIIDSILTS